MSLAHHSLVAWQRADDVAPASLAEVGYCIHVASRLGYITEIVASELEKDVKQVGAPLAGLIRSARLVVGIRIGSAFVLIGALLAGLA